MHSCNFLFAAISSQGGKPFIDQIISDAFGWNALPGWNEETYDLTAAMKKVHSSFWQPSLFNIQISTDWENRSKNVIEVNIASNKKLFRFCCNN